MAECKHTASNRAMSAAVEIEVHDALSAADTLTAGEREPVGGLYGTYTPISISDTTSPPASELEALRKERDELRKYLSAAANDYTSLIDYLERAYTETDQPLPFEEAFSEAAAECRETSEFLRMAAEGKDVSAIYVDELTKAKEDHRAAEARLAEALKALDEIADETEPADVEGMRNFASFHARRVRDGGQADG